MSFYFKFFFQKNAIYKSYYAYQIFVQAPIAKVGEPGNLVSEIFWAGKRENRDFLSQLIDISVLKLESLRFRSLKNIS